MEGVGKESFISPFKSAKAQKGPFWESVSTNILSPIDSMLKQAASQSNAECNFRRSLSHLLAYTLFSPKSRRLKIRSSRAFWLNENPKDNIV